MLRIGQGFDLHRLVENRKLILGGIEIPFEKGLAGHSDADVLLHAIIDALIGALALGDIGKFFPDTDQQYKDANSLNLLLVITDKVIEFGYKIGNIDAIIFIEKPKLRDFIDRLRYKIADTLKIDLNQINIKAKTSEKVGIVGRGEAVIAEAVVLLMK